MGYQRWVEKKSVETKIILIEEVLSPRCLHSLTHSSIRAFMLPPLFPGTATSRCTAGTRASRWRQGVPGPDVLPAPEALGGRQDPRRARGPVSMLTRQPMEERAREAACAWERWSAIVSWRTSAFLFDRFYEQVRFFFESL